MKIDHVFPAALLSIQRGVSTAESAAGEIAQHQTSDKTAGIDDLAKNLVQLKKAQHQVDAGVFIIKTADDMLGRLLDLKA